MLAPMLSPTRVAGFIPHMLAAGDGFIEGLGGGGRLALGARLESLAIDVAARSVFSLRLDDDARARIGALLRSYFGGAAKASIWDFLARNEGDYGWSTRDRRAFSRDWFAEVDAVIAAHDAADAGARPPDLLDLMTAARDPETGGEPSAEEVRSQAASMLAAGFETTARAMFWAVYLIAQDPALQAAVRAEVRAAPAKAIGGLDDLDRWPLLRGALLEGLRLYPTASVLSRVATETDAAPGGRKIRKGSLVMVSPWVMHRHEALWTDPAVFKPERFGREPALNFAEGPFMPFGGGRRTCLGATFALTEAQITLARLIDRFEIALDDARPVMPIAIVSTTPSIDPYFHLARA
jgi:cytochrome P450